MPEEQQPTTASVLQNPGQVDDLEDWGAVPDMIEGQSHTSGKLLHKGPDGQSECGIWTCTPGYWECEVGRDEFCYFLEGRATYTSQDDEVIEVEPGTTVLFPSGWTGTCRVHEQVKKIYMCR